jgi:mono/diheme cytochrome c family protein
MWLTALLCAVGGAVSGQVVGTKHLTLEELKAAGALTSSYRNHEPRALGTEAAKPQLDAFRQDVEPVLKQKCVRCHGPEEPEGNIRIDTLDPDLLHGDDVDWWIEVRAVLSNGEMPPADEAELADEERSKIIDWLSSEIQVASAVHRIEQGHSSFRRMTRYEYNYALQDLLGIPYNLAKDLPPESTSEDGFFNSSEMLHMSPIQFATYRELSRNALERTTVRGERPELLHWGVAMKDAAAVEWAKQDEQEKKIRETHKDDPEKRQQELEKHAASIQANHGRTHYKDLTRGRTATATWAYYNAKYAWAPTDHRPEVPAEFDHVAIIPPRQRLIVELGDRVPEEGTLCVRVRASRTSVEDDRVPSLQLEFGWQASNDSQATVRISERDIPVDAPPGNPKFYQWEFPLSEIYPRNTMRKIWKLGDLPNPSEYVRFVNSAVSNSEIQIDYVEVTAPVYEQWPPESHRRVFIDSENKEDEAAYAGEILMRFMSRAWRRAATVAEVDQKLALFAKIRPQCDDFQEAMIEVLATVLASPKFLYLVRSDQPSQGDDNAVDPLSDSELATRLSMFLWCSIPDEELVRLAAAGQLSDTEVLTCQVERMLADARSRRFSEQFVRQWLGMQLLDYLEVDRTAHPQYDPSLKEAMRGEPIAFFHDVLRTNASVLDFIHADYTFANERLAKHYGLSDVRGNHFRRVSFEPQHRRGGLLTQAGLLAMNSDGKDSHPLKRGIWMLEGLLNDPPPPPPPAVPEIDLADPEIAKLTLKQRIEQHRDHAACRSCHAKIDPWGIAFENFDAVGSWRTQIDGKPVDATSLLFNKQKLDGMDGLKRFLLENRQDQFARAMVHKMTTYALGRALSFSDRSSVDRITADLRKQEDGLATMVTLIVTNDLFQSK